MSARSSGQDALNGQLDRQSKEDTYDSIEPPEAILVSSSESLSTSMLVMLMPSRLEEGRRRRELE